jgi:hypothetical protein
MRSDVVLTLDRLKAACVAALLLVTASVADAHGLLLDAESDGATIKGTVYYTNGDLAVRESVELLDLTIPNTPPVPSVTDDNGRFSFPVVADRRYRVSAYGEEGHSVDVELDAKSDSQPRLVETDTSATEESMMPPAWAAIGGALLLSLIPAWIGRKRRRAPT